MGSAAKAELLNRKVKAKVKSNFWLIKRAIIRMVPIEYIEKGSRKATDHLINYLSERQRLSMQGQGIRPNVGLHPGSTGSIRSSISFQGTTRSNLSEKNLKPRLLALDAIFFVSKALSTPVDGVTPGALPEPFRAFVMAEARPL